MWTLLFSFVFSVSNLSRLLQFSSHNVVRFIIFMILTCLFLIHLYYKNLLLPYHEVPGVPGLILEKTYHVEFITVCLTNIKQELISKRGVWGLSQIVCRKMWLFVSHFGVQPSVFIYLFLFPHVYRSVWSFLFEKILKVPFFF